jgi:hypothetical protein
MGRGEVRRAATIGRRAARAGRGLAAALDELRRQRAAVDGPHAERAAPDEMRAQGAVPLAEVVGLVEAWADETLRPMLIATCEDPVSGLASPAYLGTRLAEVYRDAHGDGRAAAGTAYLLIVVLTRPPEPAQSGLDAMLHRLVLGGALRAAFPGGETIAALGPDRAAVLARCRVGLAGDVRGVRGRLAVAGIQARTWLASLPPTLQQARDLLREAVRLPADF